MSSEYNMYCHNNSGNSSSQVICLILWVELKSPLDFLQKNELNTLKEQNGENVK